jgi:hypothetical protein
MEERAATPALQEFPQLSLLHFLSPQNQDLIKHYLVYKQLPRSPRRNELPVKLVDGALVMHHQYPACALV